MKLGTFGFFGAAIVMLAGTLAHCTSSNFGGTAGKDAVSPSDAANSAAANAAANAGANGNGAGADANSSGSAVSNANAGGAGGALANPCLKNSSGSAVATPKNSLLFYAPADYTATGGPEGTQNTYLNEVQSYLEAAGYKITVVNAVTQVPGNFNPCQLAQSYTQIWLWLPCNNAQVMGTQSMAAVQSFYNYGGPVALFTDNHFFAEGEPNTHCDGTNWGGTTASPSDAVAFAHFLGATLNYGSLAGMNPTATPAASSGGSSTAATFAQLWAAIDWTTLWGMITVGSPLPPHSTVLPMTTAAADPASSLLGSFGGIINGATNLTTTATYGVLIETPATATAMPKEALIFTPSYGFHFPSGTPADSGYKALADYFETKVSALTVANTPAPTTGTTASAATTSTAAFGSNQPAPAATLALTDRASVAPTSSSPAAAQVTVPPRPAYELRLDLNSPHKEAVVFALKDLAKQGELTADDLMPFMDHTQYIVRLTANIAARLVPRADILVRLKTVLRTPDHSTNLTISAARSLAAIAGWEALPDLQQALATETDPLAKSELQLAVTDLSALAAP